MAYNSKKFFIDFILSLLIMSSVIISTNYIAKNLVNSNFFMKHISEIKSKDNIFDKTIVLLKKDTSELTKKYIEAVIDSFIEFEQIPSFDDIKYFFKLIISSSEYNLNIKYLKIYNNKMVVTYEFKDLNSKKKFIQSVKNNWENISFDKYDIINDVYIVRICFVRNI